MYNLSELLTSQEQPKLITVTKLKQKDSSDELLDGQAEGHFRTPWLIITEVAWKSKQI